MPIVHVELLPRDIDVKRKLTEELTEVFVRTTKCAPELVRILYYELPAEQWGVGGKLHSDTIESTK